MAQLCGDEGSAVGVSVDAPVQGLDEGGFGQRGVEGAGQGEIQGTVELDAGEAGATDQVDNLFGVVG